MASRPSSSTHQNLHVVFHRAAGAPWAGYCSTDRIRRVVLYVTALFLALLGGTLLFFREMDRNRLLTDRLSELELRLQLQTTAPVRFQNLVTRAENWVPQLGDVAVICNVEAVCTAKVSFISPEGTEVRGSLLLVLETSLVRIGTSGSGPYRRYYVYPAQAPIEDLAVERLRPLQKRPFQFSQALQTSTQFRLSAEVMPKEFHIFLFDSNDTLVLHERRSVQVERD